MRQASLIITLVIILGLAGWVFHNRFDTGQLADVTGHLPDLSFSLTDDEGRPETQQSYRGEIVMLYFGFTGCSSQCPLMMARLAALTRQTAANATPVRVLFVSVTPGRDTPATLHRYLAAFDPARMTGLTGAPHEVETLAKNLRASYPAVSNDRGDIPHSNIVYIFDASGRARLLATPQDSDDEILKGLKRLSVNDR